MTYSSLSIEVRPPSPKRFSAQELFAMEIPEQNYLIPGIIPYGLTTLIGKSKIGKSWFSLQLALAVATGGTFLGQQVPQGDVLYLALEDVPGRLQTRLQELGAVPGDWANHLEFWLKPSDTLDDTLAEMERWLQAAPNAQAIFIDVMGRILPTNPGRDEYQFYTQVLGKIQSLSQEYGVAIVLVHHAKKGISQSGDPFDQILGSTAIMSNSDASLLLERGRNEQQARLHVTGRDVEEREIALQRNGVHWELSAAAAEPPLSSARQGIIDAIRAGKRSPSEIVKATSRERGAVQQLLKVLVSEGLVIKTDRGLYNLPSKSPVEAHDITDFATRTQDDILNLI
ncbi:AAA family ATPase [Deinococcus taklimakanensis]|uniref:AAA family ATPase n=1 Tax=Deinococcus taklimakanensis TaxID=536443 RepID=A0ABW5P7D5_9DEIO